MVFEARTPLAPGDVLDRAVEFFANRVPLHAAFPEVRTTNHVVLRGQGGEEVALTARAGAGGTHVRASTLMFDHALERFLGTLPPAMSQ
jgi:hypothetical protein